MEPGCLVLLSTSKFFAQNFAQKHTNRPWREQRRLSPLVAMFNSPYCRHTIISIQQTWWCFNSVPINNQSAENWIWSSCPCFIAMTGRQNVTPSRHSCFDITLPCYQTSKYWLVVALRLAKRVDRSRNSLLLWACFQQGSVRNFHAHMLSVKDIGIIRFTTWWVTDADVILHLHGLVEAIIRHCRSGRSFVRCFVAREI